MVSSERRIYQAPVSMVYMMLVQWSQRTASCLAHVFGYSFCLQELRQINVVSSSDLQG